MDDDALPEVDDAAVVDDEPASVDETGAEPELDAEERVVVVAADPPSEDPQAPRPPASSRAATMPVPRRTGRCAVTGSP